MRLDKSLVASLPVFAGFCGADLDDIAFAGEIAALAKNSHVFEQGAEASSFFCCSMAGFAPTRSRRRASRSWFVSSGPANCSASPLRSEAAVYPANALAVVDSVALVWPSAAWPSFRGNFPALAGGMMRSSGGDLQESQARLAEMSTQEVERRVANMLLRLAAQGGCKQRGRRRLRFPDLAPGRRRDDGHDALHGEPHPRPPGRRSN